MPPSKTDLVPCDMKIVNSIFFYIFHAGVPQWFWKFKKLIDKASRNSMDLSRKYFHDHQERSFLHAAISHCTGPGNRMAAYILKKGGMFDDSEMETSWVAHMAYTRSFMDNSRKLVDAMAKHLDINTVFGDGHTVLTMACERTIFFDGEFKNFEIMLEKGADPNHATPCNGDTSFHRICRGFGFPNRDEGVDEEDMPLVKRNLQLIELFMKHGADIHLKNNDGESCHGILSKSIRKYAPDDRIKIMSMLHSSKLK